MQSTPSGRPTLRESIRTGLSFERFARYCRAGDAGPEVGLARYLWNVALCEALYPSLHIFEIALRNALHTALAYHMGCDDWLLRPNVLARGEVARVYGACNELQRRRKPVTPGAVVAELTCGFWTSLLDLRYEQILWPRLLPVVFPHVPRRLRTRAVMSYRIERFRRLRNRVFHHEAVYHWHDLSAQHAELTETIGWINSLSYDMTRQCCTFATRYREGWQAYLEPSRQALARYHT
jgi:hypothetical protein